MREITVRKITTLSLVAAAVWVCVILSSGCSFTWAARATLAARDSGDAVAKGMAEQTKAVTAKCVKQCQKEGKLDKPCYRACVAPWKVHRDRFRSYAAPAISGLVTGGYTAIKLAKDAGADGDKAKQIGLGVVCGVMKILDPFLGLIPQKWRDIAKGAADALKGAVCK